MEKQDRENTIVLFVNEYKKTENQPDIKGKMNVDGVEKECALWKKTSQDGKEYLSGVINEPYKPKDESNPIVSKTKVPF